MTRSKCGGPSITRHFMLVRVSGDCYAARLVTKNLRHPVCFYGCESEVGR